jgi:hypothetical protein
MMINPRWLVKEPPTDDDGNEIPLPEGALGWALNVEDSNAVQAFYPYHELFPLDPVGAYPKLEFRDIVRIKVHRHAPGGGEHTREVSAKKYTREELPDFEAVVERFGGGVYQYQGFARNGQISAWSPGGKDRDRSSAPMLALDGSGEPYTPPAAPTPAAAPAAAPREPSPFELFQMQQAQASNKSTEIIIAAFGAAVSLGAAYLGRPVPAAVPPTNPLELVREVLALKSATKGDGDGGGFFAQLEKFTKARDLLGGGEDSTEATLIKALAPTIATRLLPPEGGAASGGGDMEERLRAMERRIAQPMGQPWTVGGASSSPPAAPPPVDFDALLEELDRNPAKKEAMNEALRRRRRREAAAAGTPPPPDAPRTAPGVTLPTIGEIAIDPAAKDHVWACIERRDMRDPILNVLLETYARLQPNPSKELAELRGEAGEQAQSLAIGRALGVLAGFGFRPAVKPTPKAAPPAAPPPKAAALESGFSLTEEQIVAALNDPEVVAGLSKEEHAELTELARPYRERRAAEGLHS